MKERATRPFASLRGGGGVVRRHWLLVVFLTLGVVLRVLATIAYRPAIVYTDSVQYLTNMGKLGPDQLNPIGYDFVLGPLVWIGGLTFVVIVQHLVGLLLGVAIYALARRLTVYRWLAAVAAAPSCSTPTRSRSSRTSWPRLRST